MKPLVDFLFEAGFLKKLARSGYPFLGSGNESVADHTCRVLYIAYVLSHLEKDVNTDKLLKMCLFHDLPETRMGDLNYVNKKYVHADEDKVLKELEERVPFGREIASLIREFNEKESKEALLANDADQLDLLFHVKEQGDIGNLRAGSWIDFAFNRLSTQCARQLAREAMNTDSTDWWFGREEEKEAGQ